MANGQPQTPPPTPLTERVTKTGLLAQLRALERQLYSADVVNQVKAQFKDQPDQQIAFAQSRLHLTATIAQLNATLMSEIQDELAAQATALQAGINNLSAELDRLDEVANWAQAVNGILTTLGKVISIL